MRLSERRGSGAARGSICVKAVAAIVALFLDDVGGLRVCSPSATALVPRRSAGERLVMIGVLAGGAPLVLSPVIACPLRWASTGLIESGLDFVVDLQAFGAVPKGVYDDTPVADVLATEVALVVVVPVLELVLGDAGRGAPFVG